MPLPLLFRAVLLRLISLVQRFGHAGVYALLVLIVRAARR